MAGGRAEDDWVGEEGRDFYIGITETQSEEDNMAQTSLMHCKFDSSSEGLGFSPIECDYWQKL